jgi:type VI secretion system secreted protein Hcp
MSLNGYFLKIGDIKGESADDRHKDEIDVESWSWGEVQPASPASSGAAVGKVQMQDFQFAMKTSRASPSLLVACATGEHFSKAVLSGRKAGKSPGDFLVITLTDVHVTSFQTGDSRSSDPVLLDRLTLGYGTVEYEYRLQKPDGTLDAPIKVGWDRKANRRV